MSSRLIKDFLLLSRRGGEFDRDEGEIVRLLLLLLPPRLDRLSNERPCRTLALTDRRLRSKETSNEFVRPRLLPQRLPGVGGGDTLRAAIL